MDNRDVRVLKKIRGHIEAVLSYCAACGTLAEFEADSMRVEACVFNLMQIGELAKVSLSDEAKDEITAIPWRQIYGLRNRIVHGYAGVDMSIVWEVITNDLPGLKKNIETHLNE